MHHKAIIKLRTLSLNQMTLISRTSFLNTKSQHSINIWNLVMDPVKNRFFRSIEKSRVKMSVP